MVNPEGVFQSLGETGGSSPKALGALGGFRELWESSWSSGGALGNSGELGGSQSSRSSWKAQGALGELWESSGSSGHVNSNVKCRVSCWACLASLA